MKRPIYNIPLLLFLALGYLCLVQPTLNALNEAQGYRLCNVGEQHIDLSKLLEEHNLGHNGRSRRISRALAPNATPAKTEHKGLCNGFSRAVDSFSARRFIPKVFCRHIQVRAGPVHKAGANKTTSLNGNFNFKVKCYGSEQTSSMVCLCCLWDRNRLCNSSCHFSVIPGFLGKTIPFFLKEV